jgi:hypothetical protein
LFSVLLFCSHEVAHVPQAVEIPATRPPLVVLVFAFATLSVNRIALRETGREIEMYPSASKVFGFCCCDCTRFCANLQKREIIQLPLPSAQRKPDPCPRIRARLGESIGECIVVVEAWRDPRPPGGRRHLHWQFVSAHAGQRKDPWSDLSDVLPTGFYGAVTTKVSAGSTVYIAGAGPVGLAAAASARILGGRRHEPGPARSRHSEFASRLPTAPVADRLGSGAIFL